MCLGWGGVGGGGEGAARRGISPAGAGSGRREGAAALAQVAVMPRRLARAPPAAADMARSTAGRGFARRIWALASPDLDPLSPDLAGALPDLDGASPDLDPAWSDLGRSIAAGSVPSVGKGIGAEGTGETREAIRMILKR